MEELRIHYLQTVSYTPESNSIERLWNYLKKQVTKELLVRRTDQNIPKPQNPKYNCINIKVKYKRNRTSGKSISYSLTPSSDDLLNQPASGCRTSCDSVHMW